MAASVTPLWSSHTPVCCNRGFFPALAAQASASLQAPSSGSVQVLGYRYGDGVLAVPWVTLLSRPPSLRVHSRRSGSTAYSVRPTPWGRWEPVPTHPSNERWRVKPTRRGLRCVGPRAVLYSLSYPRTFWTSPFIRCLSIIRAVLASSLLPSSVRRPSSHRYHCAHWTAFGAAPCHLAVPVAQDGALRDLAMGDQPP